MPCNPAKPANPVPGMQTGDREINIVQSPVDARLAQECVLDLEKQLDFFSWPMLLLTPIDSSCLTSPDNISIQYCHMARYRSLLVSSLSTASAVCYYPNGNSDDNPLNGRCASIEDQASACCAINRANPSGGSADASDDGQTADLCMKNGLCKNIKTERENGTNRNVTLTSYWRGLCSTPEWPEANCVDVCSSGSVCT